MASQRSSIPTAPSPMSVPQSRAFLHYGPDELIGKQESEFVPPDDRGGNAEAMETGVEDGSNAEAVEVRFWDAEGA